MTHWIVCYDVRDNRRRRRVALACEARLRRVQKSVFEGPLRADEKARLEQELGDAMDPETDAILLIPLSEAASSRILRMGVQHEPPAPDTWWMP